MLVCTGCAVAQSAKRSQAVPDLPPIADAMPGYDVSNWFGVLAPRGTARSIVVRINSGLHRRQYTFQDFAGG